MMEANNEQVNDNGNALEAPAHLQGMQVLAEGYAYYMSYLKDGGDDGVSQILGDLQIEGL